MKNGLKSIEKGKIVAIFGYREDGKWKAQQLRREGVKVVFGIRRDRDEWDAAHQDGEDVLSPEEAARIADIIQVW
ncbi:hypothetical protein LLE49_00125 [Alicyclobacillus tolerans]|uniref:hypothetical protein n=1 Tax=Alicyclobacillus tolerans TaxID=90970 RepID=UPI001F3F6B54|nr:hypothetical protein [Alicyclobacillus tolerans]MCF8563148.1 hypothetical protein [Alicyclobacillus tolerans]